MRAERIAGGLAVLFGVFLLLVLTPWQVKSYGGGMSDPTLFPDIAATLLVLLGALQIAVPPPAEAPADRRELGRAAAVVALTGASLAVMHGLGYLPAGFLLMAGLLLLMRERRVLWLVAATLGLPLAIWALFVVVLERPLP